MTTDTPSAEAMAAELDKRVVTRWVHAVGDTPHQFGYKPDAMCRNAAAMLRVLSARVADYETRLSAVMPPDFKDWHQNSRAEWPEMAAWVVTNLRARLAEVEAERDALRAALDAAKAPREVPKLSQADIEEIVLRVPYEGDTTTPWRAEWTEQIGAPLIRAVEARVRELCGVKP